MQLLNDINFSVNDGEQLALVGFSGSGKSTLAHCIGQLYKYTSGHIRIGDREVADLTKKDMAYNLGLVSQSPQRRSPWQSKESVPSFRPVGPTARREGPALVHPKGYAITLTQ